MAEKAIKRKHRKDADSFKCKRNRNDDHLANCNSGYYKPVKWPFAAVHHIVTVSSVADATIFDQLGEDFGKFMFIYYCLEETEWDVNGADNCMGLPMKLALVYKSAKRWNGYPCHEIDHNPHYTKEVSKNLNENVWQPAIKKAKPCEFDPKSLEPALKDRSDHWRDFLVTRGNSNEGTAFCWEHRFDIDSGKVVPKDGKPFYYPFSMHPGTPTKRQPYPDWNDFSGKLKDYLKEMFTIIK